MKEQLKGILDDALGQIEKSEQLDKLNEIRVNFLGKKGQLTQVLKSMKDVDPKDRPKIGQMVNEARVKLEEKLEEKKAAFEKIALEAQLATETIDVTLPAVKPMMGHRHPNTIALELVENIFVGLGYEVVEGPEVEYDYYNFEALNIPANLLYQRQDPAAYTDISGPGAHDGTEETADPYDCTRKSIPCR